MTKADQVIHAIERRNVTLECSAEGYPLRVEWKKAIGGLEVDLGRDNAGNNLWFLYTYK